MCICTMYAKYFKVNKLCNKSFRNVVIKTATKLVFKKQSLDLSSTVLCAIRKMHSVLITLR